MVITFLFEFLQFLLLLLIHLLKKLMQSINLHKQVLSLDTMLLLHRINIPSPRFLL